MTDKTKHIFLICFILVVFILWAVFFVIDSADVNTSVASGAARIVWIVFAAIGGTTCIIIGIAAWINVNFR